MEEKKNDASQEEGHILEEESGNIDNSRHFYIKWAIFFAVLIALMFACAIVILVV